MIFLNKKNGHEGWIAQMILSFQSLGMIFRWTSHYPPLKLRVRTWKLMVGRYFFLVGMVILREKRYTILILTNMDSLMFWLGATALCLYPHLLVDGSKALVGLGWRWRFQCFRLLTSREFVFNFLKNWEFIYSSSLINGSMGLEVGRWRFFPIS